MEAAYFRGQINDSQTTTAPLLPIYELNGAPTSAQVLIMGPDDFIVAMVRYASSDSGLGTRDHVDQEGGGGWVGVRPGSGLTWP